MWLVFVLFSFLSKWFGGNSTANAHASDDGDPFLQDRQFQQSSSIEASYGDVDDSSPLFSEGEQLFSDIDESGFGSTSMFNDEIGISAINPANGLPMYGAVDIEGNPFGVSSNHMGSDIGLGFDDGIALSGGLSDGISSGFDSDMSCGIDSSFDTSSSFDDSFSSSSFSDDW